VQEFLDKNGTTVVPCPPYTPDLAPCDFFLLPELKLAPKGRRFNDIITIQKTNAGYTCRVQNAAPAQMFSTLARIMGSRIKSQGHCLKGTVWNNRLMQLYAMGKVFDRTTYFLLKEMGHTKSHFKKAQLH
jgi:hypothetical protein